LGSRGRGRSRRSECRVSMTSLTCPCPPSQKPGLCVWDAPREGDDVSVGPARMERRQFTWRVSLRLRLRARRGQPLPKLRVLGVTGRLLHRLEQPEGRAAAVSGPSSRVVSARGVEREGTPARATQRGGAGDFFNVVPITVQALEETTEWTAAPLMRRQGRGLAKPRPPLISRAAPPQLGDTGGLRRQGRDYQAGETPRRRSTPACDGHDRSTSNRRGHHSP
jgi:hypothetical protein